MTNVFEPDWFHTRKLGHPEGKLFAADLKSLKPDDYFLAIDE